MIIHYKTLILNKIGEEELLGKQVIEKNRKYCITYCCDTMEQAISDDAITLTGIDLYFRVYGYEGSEDYIFPIGYCPFCGKKIQQVEEYRARLQNYNAKIPDKTIKAHYEARTKEIKI